MLLASLPEAPTSPATARGTEGPAATSSERVSFQITSLVPTGPFKALSGFIPQLQGLLCP